MQHPILGLLDLDEFRPGLLRALLRALPADWISLNDLAAVRTEEGMARTTYGVRPQVNTHKMRG